MPEAPRCSRCRHRHRPDLPCWRGKYARELTALVLAHSRSCFICGGWATEADHLIPRADGGGDEVEGPDCNLLPACRRCNAGKADKAPHYPPIEIHVTGQGLSERWRRWP